MYRLWFVPAPSPFTAALMCLGMASAAVAGCTTSADSRRERLVITSERLAQNLGDPTLVLLHVGSEDEFNQEHIPGARYVRMPAIALALDSTTGLRNELPNPSVLRDEFEALGVSGESTVVVYSANDRVLYATRVLFTLDYVGLGKRAALLDGGLLQWKHEGRPVTSGVDSFERGTIAAGPTRDLVVDAEWVAAKLGRPGYHLLDARPQGQFTGQEEQAGVRPGHIAGAGNVPLTELFDSWGRIRHPGELERVFSAAGLMPGDTVVAYCFTGVLGTGITFAAKTLGYEALLYDGSYEEWGADAQRPVETGRAGPQ